MLVVRYGSMNKRADLQQNSLKSLIDYNFRNDTDINANLHNRDGSSGINFLNRHTPPKITNQVT